MNIALWIAAGLLGVVMLISGAIKIFSSREQLEKNMEWVKDSKMGFVRLVALLEILGAIGVILPGAIGVSPALVPWAAMGLALIMAGAIVLHIQRGEGFKAALPAIVLLALAVFVAWGRFGAYAFSA